ncbi:MAG: DUF4158 domain-containing protein [Acidimicrobiales bacterium]
MRQHWEADELVEHWGPSPGDLGLIRNKTGPTRLGFTVMLEHFEAEGRFPASADEVPAEVVRFLAVHVGVPPEALASYRWAGRSAGARHSIELEMYELGNPAIVSALESARRRGVTVRVVSDPTEYQSRTSDADLAHGGVAVRKLTVHCGIDHVKLLVVNDARVLVGGVNLGAASSYTTDADVELSGPAVGPATTVFNRDWAAGGSGAPASGVFGPFVTGEANLPAPLRQAASGINQTGERPPEELPGAVDRRAHPAGRTAPRQYESRDPFPRPRHRQA